MKYLILSVLFPLILNRAGDNRLGSSSSNGIVCSGRSAACCTRLQLTCSSRQVARSQPVLSSIHLIQEGLLPLGLFFFLCDLCHCFTCVVASRERLEPPRAVKYRRLVGETTGSAVCEKCVYQSRLQAVNTVCETLTQRRRRLLSAHLPFWSFDHRQWAHQTWLTGTPHMKNALKSLWSLYDLPFMCVIVLMCW